MKKLLSILGAVGLTATATMSVVSCSSSDSNNPSHSYKDLTSWINESKDKTTTDLVFIGGRNDSDTVSWLAARQAAVQKNVNTQDLKDLTKTSNVDKYDAQFSNWINQGNSDSINIKNSITGWTGPVAPGTGNAMGYSPLVYNQFWGTKNDSGEPNNFASKIAVHSILVDDLSSLFNAGLGKKFIDSALKDQATSWVDWWYNVENIKPVKDKEKEEKKTVKAINDAMAKVLQANKQPLFLVFNNGQLSGITTGFKNYYCFNNSIAKGPESDFKNTNNDLNQFFNYLRNNIWGTNGEALYPRINTMWAQAGNTDGLLIANSGINKNGWTNAGLDVDPSKQTDNSNGGNSDSGSDSNNGSNTNAYKLEDITKYIN